MKRSFVKKLLILLLILTTFMIFIVNNNVMAANIEETKDNPDELEILIEPEDKIMKYDARTNETTEVDMEEIRQALSSKANSNKTTTNLPSANLLKFNKFSMNNKLNSLNVLAASTQKINNTSSYPNVTVCRIQVNANLVPTVANGTAAIVGTKLALTAAHCVFNPDNNNQAYPGWTIYPGYNNGTYYGTATGWDTVYYSNNWMSTHDSKYDWAICVLQASVGSQVGNMGAVCYSTNAELNGTSIRALGYPADTSYGYTADAKYQYQSSGTITSVTNEKFISNAFSCNGFSGSPVIRSDNLIVGITSGINSQGTHCVRITQDMVNLINNLNSNS